MTPVGGWHDALSAQKLIFVFDNYVLDTGRRELRCGYTVVSVQPQVFDLLEYLIRNRGHVISRDDLLDAVWGGRIVSESTLATRINAARSAIGDDGESQRLIRTLPRKGIRFVGDVREEEEEEQPRARRATDVTFEDAGDQKLTNITRPARAYRAQPAKSAGTALALPDKPSVAVLSFKNMSDDPKQQYFADGMADDIITGLSRIKWLFVIARNSSFTYKDRAIDVKQVGRELGVRYVLQGSVRKAGDRVRITGQLVDVATGAHIWADRYDRMFEDIFALQDEITLSVVGAIEPSLRLAEIERVKRKRPDSLDSYDLVLRAQSDVYSRMPERATKALPLLERALALDPNYALAHAYAAECHHILFLRGGLNEENRKISIRHAEAAITHGQDDAVALSFAGFVIGMDKHDRPTAFATFEAALAVSPSSALTYILGSVILAYGGDPERAIEWANRGLRLTPFDPYRASAFCAASYGHFQSGRFEDSVDAARKAILAAPGFSVCYMALAAPLAKLGLVDEAKAAAARVLELQPNFRCSMSLKNAGCMPSFAVPFSEALHAAGLPE